MEEKLEDKILDILIGAIKDEKIQTFPGKGPYGTVGMSIRNDTVKEIVQAAQAYGDARVKADPPSMPWQIESTLERAYEHGNGLDQYQVQELVEYIHESRKAKQL